MEYVKAAQISDFEQTNKKKVSLKGKDILLARVEDTYYAVDDTCPHMGASLSGGKLEGYNIVCPRHGSTFDLRTGKLAEKGKIGFMKFKTADINTYPVKTEGEDILIGI